MATDKVKFPGAPRRRKASDPGKVDLPSLPEPDPPRINWRMRNELTRLRDAELLERIGITPLEFLLGIMTGDVDKLRQWNIKPEEITTRIRIAAAESAAPYCHRKMPIGVDDGHGGPIGIYNADHLMQLSDADIEALALITDKLALLSGEHVIEGG